MIHIIYDKNSPVAFNDAAIMKIADKIVKEHGSTEEIHECTVGQELFLSAIRSAMCVQGVSHENLVVFAVDDEKIHRITINDCYSFETYVHFPNIVCEILMPLF
ncbi:hypothetical protein FDG95_gp368 [Pectobacterium phage vB_PcaM_CBB]|uniref:Uncharacterized protein n=1 Tax=Pectobacterium phage vB_PcaM_CBB TaxID=2772511 RepID=A0A1L2CV82_9CAUD|nr:hypothetical protein FDG95_gp368 [Pectobacterium phage vB_PcaM_CBB]AMM43931.1 hypothetical protein CBB_368 [Pectobacterium phage vB_PcaM_CBB]